MYPDKDKDFRYDRFDYRGDSFSEYMMKNDNFYSGSSKIGASTYDRLYSEQKEIVDRFSNMYENHDYDAHVFSYYDDQNDYRHQNNDWE